MPANRASRRETVDVDFELVGIPFSSAGTPGGITSAIAVLRELGLAERLAATGGVHDGGDVAIGEQSPERASGRLRNEEGVIALVERTRDAVAAAHRRGRLPLLVGGDCPVILGALATLASYGEPPGLVMIDGHEDAYPPSTSPTGEASDSELGIALGMFDDAMPPELEALTPLLAPEQVAMIGPRDRAELAVNAVRSLANRVWSRTDAEVREHGAATIAREATEAAESGGSIWLHLDLDVLATEGFRAADYLQPGGLSWAELEETVRTVLEAPACGGLSIVIYNPDLDPDRRDGERIVQFAEAVLSAL